MNLAPAGFVLDEAHAKIRGPIVTVATDLPVHKTLHVRPLDEGGSPLLWLTHKMPAQILAWRQRLETLQALREAASESLEQLAGFIRSCNWEMTDKCLVDAFQKESSDGQAATIHFAYRTVHSLFLPILGFDGQVELYSEYYGFLNDCLQNKRTEYRTLMTAFAEMPLYRAFRSKVIGVYLRVLSHFHALMVGLLYDSMPPELKADIDEYRVFRADYPVVKGLFQDLFELL